MTNRPGVDARPPSDVLLVDDDPRLLMALGATLRARMSHLSVEECASGPTALERIRANEYDVVVTDCLMPGVGGAELLDHARRLRPNTLVILVTGLDDRELTLRALRAGAYDFIQKPVDPDYFAASVGRAIEARRLRRAVALHQAELQRHAERLEQTVEVRTRALREAHRVKDEFLATISHELRTPLTAILGWARLLHGGQLDAATQAQAIESVARNARSQAQLIDDLLDISRIITGKLRLDIQRLDIHRVVDAALASVLPGARAKGIALEPIMAGDIGPIDGDPERIQQILWNLLSNAVKFTHERGRIELRVARDAARVEIHVRDDGCGIGQDFLPYVFDRLRQGDSAQTTGSRRGLGVGLAIARHLAELHGGTLTAVSPGEGRGSTFTLVLPCATVEVAPLAPRKNMRFTLPSRDSDPSVGCLRGVRILVVDDEPDARDMLRLTLEHAGAVVAVAASGDEALHRFMDAPPDLLLCDIGLPDMDGYAIVEAIRTLPPEDGGLVPAIALTAFARPEDRERALAAGFQLHLAKPGPADLAMIVAGMLEGHPAG